MTAALNCRPNDVARVIAPGRIAHCPFCCSPGVTVKPDTFVRVTTHDGAGWWFLEEAIEGTTSFQCGQQFDFTCTSLPDEILRPIRHPGDDAVDEMVRGVSCEITRTGEVAHG